MLPTQAEYSVTNLFDQVCYFNFIRGLKNEVGHKTKFSLRCWFQRFRKHLNK